MPRSRWSVRLRLRREIAEQLVCRCEQSIRIRKLEMHCLRRERDPAQRTEFPFQRCRRHALAAIGQRRNLARDINQHRRCAQTLYSNRRNCELPPPCIARSPAEPLGSFEDLDTP